MDLVNRRQILALCLTIVSCVIFPSLAKAQDSNLLRDTFILEDILVIGSPDDLHRTNAVVVEKSRSNNLADFLVRDSEISFTRRSNFGDSSDILSIRGMNSQRIKVNVDDRDISSNGVVGGNFLDFGTIPLDNVESLEIIKGGSAIEYGNAAIGGVVNVRTSKPTEKAFLSLYGTFGGFEDLYDFYNIRGAYAQKFGPLGISIGISHQKNEAYLRNNPFELFHVNPKIYLDTPWQGQLILSYNYSRAKRGIIKSNRDDNDPTSDSDFTLPGWDRAIDPRYPVASGESFAGSTPTPSMSVIGDDAHWIKQRHLFDVGYKQEFGGIGFAEFTYYANKETRRELNYADIALRTRLSQISPGRPDGFNPALTRQGAMVMDREVTVDLSYGYKLKSELTFGDHLIKFGGEHKLLRSGGTTIDFVDLNYNRDRRNSFTGVMNSSGASEPIKIYSFYAGDSYRINDTFTLDFGLRYDSFKDNPESGITYSGSGFSPKVALAINFNENHRASIAIYRNVRTPTSPEIFWFREATEPGVGTLLPLLSGAKLKPEKTLGIDAAYRYDFGFDNHVKLSAYYYDVKDFMLRKSGLPAVGTATGRASYNGDVKIHGLTLSGGYRFLDNLYAQGSISYQGNKKTRDIFDPNLIVPKIDYLPKWKGSFGLSYSPIDKLTVEMDALFVDDRPYFVASAGGAAKEYTLDSYFTLGMSATYKINDHLALEIYVDNLTGVSYQETFGYPAMGFNAGMSLKWNL
ncbi:MAG: TonB-dependent receptor [Deltaproteobacteria bacterium]|nr:TonB-dependent receptor [Deltaproteobacteria bacterium]